MKKILLCAILFILIFSTACTDNSDAIVTQTNVPDSTTGLPYLIVFSAYRDVNTVLYYPKIDGLDDLPRQDKLNALIFEDAKNAIGLFGDDIVCITIDYEIVTQEPELLGIRYTGHGRTSSDSEREVTVYYSSIVSITDEKIIR